MAVDKLVDSAQLDAGLTSIANAIRTKGGTSAQLAFPAGFVSAVQAISAGGGMDLSAIAQDVSLNNIGGLFSAFQNGTWGSVEKSFTSGTNPMTVDFGRAIKGVMYYPKSITVLSGLANSEREVLGIGIFNEEGESGSQSILWSICRKKGGTAASTAFATRASTTLANGVLSMVPDYPSNASYHPFGFNIPYMFVYWW